MPSRQVSCLIGITMDKNGKISPRTTLLKCLRKLLWDLGWRIGKVADELPVCAG